MLIIGLTGSISMGKSTVAAMFRDFGVAVHDSDACVHALYRSTAVPIVLAAFPGVEGLDGVDRAKLGAVVLNNPPALRLLESIIHPLVAEHRRAFVAEHRAKGAARVVLDIPLLLEGRGNRAVDLILVVSAQEAVQKARFLTRPGMTEARFAQIMAMQMPDEAKRVRAHMVIQTDISLAATRRAVADLLRTTSAM